MHNRFESRLLALTLFCTALGGCVAPQLRRPLEESEVIPPLPTFLTVHECEMAYGLGACGTGSQVYGQASLAAPPDAYNWYMPYSFGTMTGALLHDHYAPPGIYLAQVPYGSYLQPAVIQRYALVNPQTVRIYRSAPQPFQGGARPPQPPPAWRWQTRPERVMRVPEPFPSNPALIPSTPPIPQKPSPMPAFVNPPPHPGQRPDRLDRADRPGRPDRTDRPDRSDRSSTGNTGPRAGDRKPDEKK